MSLESSGIKIQTSKQWVLPPRPKPGRKPSLDTPTTKRKAQNRAAQRAFRERKANKIQELEQSLTIMKNERNRIEINYTNLSNDYNILNKSYKMLLVENKHLMEKLHGGASGNGNGSRSGSAGGNKGLDSSDVISNLSAKVTYLEKALQESNAIITRLQQAGASTSNVGGSDSSSRYSSAESLHSFPTPSSQISSPKPEDDHVLEDDENCGVCEKDDCLCVTIGLKKRKAPQKVENTSSAQDAGTQDTQNTQGTQGTHPDTPSATAQATSAADSLSPVALKRKAEHEVDFTDSFSAGRKQKKLEQFLKRKSQPQPAQPAQPAQQAQQSSSSSSSVSLRNDSADLFQNSELFKTLLSKDIDSCGFCSEDSPCVCREAQRTSSDKANFESKLPPILGSRKSSFAEDKEKRNKLQVLIPGLPGASGASSTTMLPGSQSASTSHSSGSSSKVSGCTGNPGTCLQCQSDPMSTLFCTTIASKVSDERSRPIIGKGRSRSGSITSLPVINVEKKDPGSSTKNDDKLFIPCSDAYKTLSRHESFNKVDFNTLVGKLNTRGMQVEVESVVNVLRELDRRLYN